MSQSPTVEGADGCVNVYIANLPPTMDASAIRAIFSPAGRVLHVKLLLDIATGTSRGIAFVMYDSMQSARKACATMNRAMVEGSMLQVRLAERSSQHQSPDSHVRSKVVYVRNVPGSVTSEQMKAYCSGRFGPVVDVTPHPQSAELGGPSPYNMLFVTFDDVDLACHVTEGLDGKAPFPIPPGHPFTMAKMVTDVAGEMRKSILLRRRSSDGSTGGVSPQRAISPSHQQQQHQQQQQQLLLRHHQGQAGQHGQPPLPQFYQQQNVSPPVVTLPGAPLRTLGGDAPNVSPGSSTLDLQRRLSQSSNESYPGATPSFSALPAQPQVMLQPQQQLNGSVPAGFSAGRRGSNASSSNGSSDGRTTLEMASQLPPTAFIPMVYSNPGQLPQMMSVNTSPSSAPQVVFLQQPLMFQQPLTLPAGQQQIAPQPQYFFPGMQPMQPHTQLHQHQQQPQH